MHLSRALRVLGHALCVVTAAPGIIGGVTERESMHGPIWIASCVEGAPGLRVPLVLPEPLVVGCAARAHGPLRCVQEIITNALRHARAENLWLSVEQTDSEITVEARDDGRGAPEVRAGNGLAGMRARLEEMGGRLAVAATPGFSVRAHLPLAPRAA